MKAVYCPYCGGRTKRNGRTSSGSQRWRCTACGASTTVILSERLKAATEFKRLKKGHRPAPMPLK